ncbi:hypothetical protein LTR95_002236 [Oleoguttula sp. CCFEE 5521]
MARDAAEQLAPGKAYSVFVRLVLPPYAIHFKAPKYMKESTLDLLDRRVTKATLAATAQKATVRHAIGTDPRFWPELNGVLKVGVVSLERRSFAVWDPTGVDYESTSGALIAGNYPGLWKDLERVNDLLSIARNVLTIGASAQDLATAHQVELEVFKLINCAVRVTARGYDGEAGAGVAGDMSEEEKWQYIVNAYKKLLITSLQFLNNLVAQNEERKLDLWMNLFDCGATSIDALMDAQDDPRDGQRKDVSNMDIPSNPTSEPIPPINGRDLRAVYGQVDEDILDSDPVSDPEGYIYFAMWNEQACAQEADAIAKSGSGPQLTAQNLIAERWSKLDKQGRESWRRKAEGVQEKYVADVKVYDAKRALQMQRQARRDAANAPDESAEPRSPTLIDEEELYEINSSGHRPIHAEDLKMHYTADAGIRILESGKAELMKRLEGYEPPQSAYSADPILAANRYREAHGIRPRVSRSIQPMPRARTVSRSPPAPMRSPAPVQPPAPQQNGAARNHADHGHVEELESEGSAHGSDEAVYGNGNAPPEEELEEDDEEEDADGEEGSNEDGRGLLTDVPLILGPSEIEVLPMIIMSGIVSPTKQLEQCRTEKERSDLANAHIVRTHLLLAQENGRNLLRELLIFVAAWDLREEELYFKFMVKIMEAVLQNGLMPFAYHAFRDRSRSRDIISPAQAVIMKLLTCIFRARGEAGKANAASAVGQGHQFDPNGTDINASIRVPRHVPRRADLQILHFIFTEFRQHIIPQTCALIFLQGQIHRARALPSDFPLNLWDMERMYEGVYGVLEFFAVVCEEGWGKEVLAGWEAASELVTLVRELEEGIPKLGLQGTLSLGGADGFGSEALSRRRVSMPQRAASADGRLLSSHAQYLPDSNRFSVQDELNARAGILPPLPPPLQTHALQPSQSQIFEPTTPLAYPEDNAEADEPSDFEWRNLKKLTVLVLSSLIWKNRNVQTQVRLHGGLEALVGCCKHDEHNPYIREHAIMCLRFAVEGCPENRARLEELAQRSRGRGSEGLPRALLPGTPGTGGHPVSFPTYPDLHVPREVLDTNGYETFMDGKGQVGLRRKEPVQTSQAAQAIAKASTAVSKVRSSAAMTAEKAAELMQSALRDLPLGGDLVSERQKAEALAKLDRAFESTERVLGGVARGGK